MIHFSKVIDKFPEDSINLGGKPSKRAAWITYSIDLDSPALTYQKVKLENVQPTHWTIDDIVFMQKVFERILATDNRSIEVILGEQNEL